MQQCLTIELVNDAWYEQHADIFLAAEKETLRNNHKCLCSIYRNAMVDRSTTGRWVRGVIAFKSGKQEET